MMTVQDSAGGPAGPVKHEYITVNGVRLHVASAGEGDPLLCLHGFPEFWYSWRHQMAGLKDHFRVIAPDMRGFNESDRPKGVENYGVDTLAGDIAQLIGALGYRQVNLVGHDWGASVAWHLALTRPELVKKLVILNGAHPRAFARELRKWKQRRMSWYIFFFQLPRLPELYMSRGNYRYLRRLFRGTAVNKQAFDRETVDRYVEAFSRPGALTATINYYRASFKVRSKARYPKTYDGDVLLIWGRQDRFLSLEMSQDNEKWVPKIQVKYIPDCGHWTQAEKPETVNRWILEFIRECQAGPE
ncbi:MAG: alpha/beta fold hydrolase [Bacillota bacterium]